MSDHSTESNQPTAQNQGPAARISDQIADGHRYCIVVLALEHFGVLNGFQTVALDTWLVALLGGTDTDVIIVEIDDEDYEQLFNGRSPLAPDLLRSVVDDIVAARPKLIGVDIDTSNPALENLARDSEALTKAISARDCRTIVSADGQRKLIREPILGGNFKELPPVEEVITTDPRSGVTLFPQDSDGLVRHYYQVLKRLPKRAAANGLLFELAHGDRGRRYEPQILGRAAANERSHGENRAQCMCINCAERQRAKREAQLAFEGENCIAGRNVSCGPRQLFHAARPAIRRRADCAGTCYGVARWRRSGAFATLPGVIGYRSGISVNCFKLLLHRQGGIYLQHSRRLCLGNGWQSDCLSLAGVLV